MERVNKGKSIIDFPEEYVCIDVETTGLDFDFDEVIEVSAVYVKNGEIIDRFSSLVKPSCSHVGITFGMIKALGYENFSDVPKELMEEISSQYLIPTEIEELTGITNEMIKGAPSGADVFLDYYKFLSDHILVGHNVNFDINFIYDAFQEYGLNLTNDFIDTMRISRKLFPEYQHHRLSDLKERLNIQQGTVHRAEADAIATQNCFEAMKQIVIKDIGIQSFIESFKRKSSAYRNRLLSIQPTVDEFDETNPLFDKAVVFTGALSNMARKDAFQLVANLGGYPQDTVTKETNFLVVGSKEFSESVKNGMTAKMKKAEAYRKKGQEIVTLSEDTFFEIIK